MPNYHFPFVIYKTFEGRYLKLYVSLVPHQAHTRISVFIHDSCLNQLFLCGLQMVTY